jgi:hypothetical protein
MGKRETGLHQKPHPVAKKTQKRLAIKREMLAARATKKRK